MYIYTFVHAQICAYRDADPRPSQREPAVPGGPGVRLSLGLEGVPRAVPPGMIGGHRSGLFPSRDGMAGDVHRLST